MATTLVSSGQFSGRQEQNALNTMTVLHGRRALNTSLDGRIRAVVKMTSVSPSVTITSATALEQVESGDIAYGQASTLKVISMS